MSRKDVRVAKVHPITSVDNKYNLFWVPTLTGPASMLQIKIDNL
jgi:hypothetical protein